MEVFFILFYEHGDFQVSFCELQCFATWPRGPCEGESAAQGLEPWVVAQPPAVFTGTSFIVRCVGRGVGREEDFSPWKKRRFNLLDWYSSLKCFKNIYKDTYLYQHQACNSVKCNLL